MVQEPGNDGFLYYIVYTLYTDRGREPLFSIMPIPVPVRSQSRQLQPS